MTALGETNLNHNRISIHECITKLFGHSKGGLSRKSNYSWSTLNKVNAKNVARFFKVTVSSCTSQNILFIRNS